MGWQVGGHHLAINASLEGGRVVSLSPTFIGIEPASFDFQGRRYAPRAGIAADGGHYHSVYRDPTNEYGGAL